MRGAVWLCLALLASIFVSACSYAPTPNPQTPEAQIPVQACVDACHTAQAERRYLATGPCLLDPMPDSPDWVCDVAHQPRRAVDNLPENQCQSYREGRATHFVEVDPECTLIQAV